MRVFDEADEAKALVKRAGFPSIDIPSFRTPRLFWGSILNAMDKGKSHAGERRLLEAAIAFYPDNDVFKRALAHIQSDVEVGLVPSPARRHDHYVLIGLAVGIGAMVLLALGKWPTPHAEDTKITPIREPTLSVAIEGHDGEKPLCIIDYTYDHGACQGMRIDTWKRDDSVIVFEEEPDHGRIKVTLGADPHEEYRVIFQCPQNPPEEYLFRGCRHGDNG